MEPILIEALNTVKNPVIIALILFRGLNNNEHSKYAIFPMRTNIMNPVKIMCIYLNDFDTVYEVLNA